MVEYAYFTDKDGNVLPATFRPSKEPKAKSDPGAIIDVLSEVLELVETLRADVIQMLEDNDI